MRHFLSRRAVNGVGGVTPGHTLRAGRVGHGAHDGEWTTVPQGRTIRSAAA
jgi:hypothetical protein